MLSAAYDGHCGSMGPGLGARAADANMRVAMAGIAGINVQYLEAMRLWAAANRPCDGAFPAQVRPRRGWIECRIDSCEQM